MEKTENKMEEFLNQHEASTRHSYEISLKQYFEWKKADAHKYIKNLKKMNNEQKEETIQQYQKDITAWWGHIKETWTPKYTRNTKLNAIRQYLIEYEIELPIVFWKRLKTTKEKGPRASTQDRAPTRHELRKIITEGKPIARTMFLLASCTGMRIGEILQLKIGDIDLNMTPIWINIRGETTKTGDARTVFVSDETAVYLKKWINDEREGYLKNIRQRMERLSKHNHFKELKDHHKKDDDTVFPVTRQTAESYWQLMLKRANLDQRDTSTNVRVLHVHVLRKWFRTNMAKPLGLDITEAIMGHRGYLTESYRRYSKQDLAKMYQENQKHITVIQEPVDIDKLEKTMDTKMQEKDAEMQKMRTELMEMRLQILEMKTKN